MFGKKSSSESGFTIVETIIVVAVAGLILLIVLLAIPMLQRNSRNNQRKQDVQAVLEAVSHYELNNSGNFLDCGHGAFPSCVGSGHLLAYSHMTFYTDDSQVVVHLLNSGQAAPTPSAADRDNIYIYNHQKCNVSGTGATTQGAGYGDIVALYALETSNDYFWHCQQL
jgi:type II secretory pathway pseudopilin PulG